jgi:hypothetical protein
METKRVQFGLQGATSYLIWSERSVAVRPVEDTEFTMGATLDVLGLDLATNKSFVISNAPNKQANPRITGSTVVWEDNRHSCSTCEYDILGKDLATGTEFRIATGPVDQAQPAVAGKTVVWVEGDGKTDGLLAKDLATGKITTIASVPGSTNTILHPLVSTGYIVWSQLGEDNQTTRSYPVKLQAYDRKTGTTETIAEYAVSFGESPQVALSEQRLVWQGFSSLNLTDLESRETSVLYSGKAFAPVISGDTVIWAVASITPGAAGFDIYGLDLREEDRGAVVLVAEGITTGDAAIAGDQFVWQNKGGANDGRMNTTPLAQAFANAQVLQQPKAKPAPPGDYNQDSKTSAPTPSLTPGPDPQLPEAPDYTNYNSKGIHAANGDFGWYNHGIYPTACVGDGGCPAVDALGATQGTPFFGAVTALSSDLDRYTTTNSSGTNIRPTSPWGPQVKHAMRQMSNLGKRVTIRLFPTRYPNNYGTAYPDQIAQDVLGLAWRNWMRYQNVMVNNEPNNEREWPTYCVNVNGRGCYWPGSRDYFWNNYEDLRFYEAVNDWYVSAWWSINYYKDCNVNPTSCGNLQTMKMWTPPFAPLLGPGGQSKYTTMRGMLDLYDYFTYNLYADPYYQGNGNGLSNEDWGGFDWWLQNQITYYPSTFHSQINEFGWDPYTMANANCLLTHQHTWPSSGVCRAQDNVTHTLSDDATRFLNNSAERHNAEAIHLFIVRGGGNNDNDGLDPDGGLWYYPLGTWRWLFHWQRASPNP